MEECFRFGIPERTVNESMNMIDSPAVEPELAAQDEPEKEYLSVQDVCRRMNVSKFTVNELLNKGVIPFYQFGAKDGARRIHRADLAAYIASRRTVIEPKGKASPAPRARRKFSVLEPGRKHPGRRTGKRKAG